MFGYINVTYQEGRTATFYAAINDLMMKRQSIKQVKNGEENNYMYNISPDFCNACCVIEYAISCLQRVILRMRTYNILRRSLDIFFRG